MGCNIRTIKEIKPYLVRELSDTYPEPEINAFTTILIKTILGVSRLHAITRPEEPVSKKISDKIISVCTELKLGKPLQYILGETDFYNCRIKVSPDVMIPRPETEELVDMIIKDNRDYNGEILDACCGSGCIAVALALNLPESKVSGTDISEEAIKISVENAKLNNVTAKFSVSDIKDTKPDLEGEKGIIVSNPPYIRESEKKDIAKNVLDFEPPTALFVPDSDPLVFYKAIIRQSESKLTHGGKVYFEINELMGKEIEELLKISGFSNVVIIKDINGKNRFAGGIKI